jgi:phytoene/squalene synthetase
MQSLDFYQKHLDRVSRSFAFCIQKLELPLRQWVSLSYLLCRTLDTVEDSSWESSTLRNAQYDAFERFLHRLPKPNEVSIWASQFPSTIPEGEKILLQDAFFLFEDLHQLSEELQKSIQQTVLRMSAGMRHYASVQETTGGLKLADLLDVNRYCYFVAGIVGELLTRLMLQHRPDFKAGPALMKNAFHFGLFLQKVNLLKDQRTDEREGRFLVPDREVLLASLRENARGSVDYLTSLPRDEKGFRIFCGWSLFLGAASLPWIQQSFNDQDTSKIPRSVTQELLQAVEEICQEDDALKAELETQLENLPKLASDIPLNRNGSEWFFPLSGGVLSSEDLQELLLA